MTVDLTDCDSTDGITVQRVYISGTTGVNDITLTGCDFGTKATSVYSNADGNVVIDNCSFTGAQVPVNFNHKANGTQTVAVQNSTFTNCGDNGDWEQFAAPVRFVNSGSGTMTTTVATCTFTGTVGSNGDILLGDGREGQKSNDVALTVESTEATVQAQQPGYYGKDGTTDASKQGTKTVAAGDKLTTSVTQLMPSSELTNYVTVSGIKGFDGTKFATFADAYAAIKPVVATLGLGQETPADAAAFDAVFTDISNGKATLTYTITGNVTYDETGLDHLLTMGRKSSHYLTNERHLINFKFVGAEADRGATLTVNSNITLPYEWWGEKITTSISFENLTITGSAPSGLFANQSFFEGIDFKVNNCTLKGIKIYNCANVGGSYTITNSKLDGTGAAKDAYAIHLQGNDTAPLNILIENNQISGYDRGVNIDQATAIATISGNSISINDSNRSCIQLTQLAKTTVSGNSMTLSGGNAITLHGNLAAGSKIEVIGNNITGTGYLIYDAAKGTIDLTYTGNTVSDTIDTTKGVYGGKEYEVSENVANALKPDTTTSVAEVNGTEYETLQAAIDAAAQNATVTLLADAAEDVVISKSITLDLGGKTLTNTNGGKATISVTGGTVTVKNGNVVGGTSYYNIEAKKDANLTLTDVTATAGNTGSSMIDNWGTLTITSGTYTGGLNVVKSEEGSVLNISGGTFTLSYATSGYTGVIFAYGDTTISGGEFIQSLTTTGRWNHPTVILTGVVEGYAAITRVTGGHFVNKMSGESIFRGVGKGTSDNFEVSGGTFNKSIPDGYCADGFIPTKNTDGTYGVKEGQYVAKVGSTKYETLADAIRLDAKGKTVKLLADVADCGSLTISKNITLDGGGHTISGNSSISVNMPGNAAADVTIKNVNFKDIANGNKLSAFYFSQVKGKLTITGCTFDSIEYEAIQVTPMEGAEVNVSSNVFKAKADGTQVRHIHIEMAYGSGFDCEGQNIKLTVTDNQLHGTVSGDASMGIWWVGTDSTLKVDGNYMEHPETVSITLSNGGVHYNRGDLIYPARSQADADVDDLIPAVIVADKASGESKIKAYSTLADAVAAAQDGQTVRLLADVEQNTQLTIGKSITLDLNGKTIKISGYTAEKAQVSVKGNLTIQDSSEAQTGKICSDYTGTAGRVVSVENGGKLTIAGGTITTEGMSGLSGSAVYIASGAEVNMTGGAVKVDAKRGNVAMNVKGSTGVFTMSGGSVIAEAGDGTETYITAISGSSGSTIQISAGTVSGPQALLAGSSATTITGGNFTGSITVKNGSISGGTFDRALDKKACAAGYVPTQNGDGTYGVEIGMFTVMVTSRTTGSNSPVANVTGGGSNITYAQGTTVTASAISGYKFVGWFVNEYTGTPYSTNLSCEVKPTDDWTMIAVYEPISGGKFWLTVTASEFTVNGGAVQDSYLYEQFAVGASVTVNFTGSENFLYWVNASNKVVSTEKSYTFIMGSETTLKAVYGKACQNQATVVFISHSDQIISSKAYTTSDTIQFPVPPIKMGCTFTGWSMTEAEIRAAMANNSGIIQVRARYTEPSIACTVTVVYPEGTDNQVVNAVVGKAIDVTAKDIEGKTFSYWTDDKGTVLGYTKTLKLAPSGDMTVKAVYDENAEVKPVISMTAIDASAGNGYWVVSFTATRAVPAGYEMVKQGILYSLDSRCAGEAGKDYLKLTADGTVPEGVYEYSGKDQALNGVTRFNGKVGTAETTLYGRGYMILKNSAGKVLNVYADTILSGSYNSVNK